jgi:hypothetical protein
MRSERFRWPAPTPLALGELWGDEYVLEAVASAYRECVDPVYVVWERPELSNHDSKEVDAILRSPSSPPIALEITRVQTWSKHLHARRLTHEYLKELERELATWVRPGVWCRLPYNVLVSERDRDATVAALRELILSVADELTEGGATYEGSLPFPVELIYEPSTGMRFHLFREDPPYEQIRTDVLRSVEKALRHKKERLAEYAALGFRTALVMDSPDPYLLTYDRAYLSFLAAQTTVGSEHVDDVLYAITCDPNAIYMMAFQGDRAFRGALNTHIMKFGPEYASNWSEPVSSAS